MIFLKKKQGGIKIAGLDNQTMPRFNNEMAQVKTEIQQPKPAQEPKQFNEQEIKAMLARYTITKLSRELLGCRIAMGMFVVIFFLTVAMGIIGGYMTAVAVVGFVVFHYYIGRDINYLKGKYGA